MRAVRRAPVKDGPLRLGFVGTLVWHKGLHVLIEALRLMPSERVRLSVHGNTDVFPQYVRELRARAEGLPVEFRGSFTHAQLADVYEQFDVLVVPSLWPENSPLVIHEAFMSGIPVVGSRTGGIVDLVTHGHNGLLYEGPDPGSLAMELRRLIANRGLLTHLAANVPPVKPIEQDAAEWEAIYGELLQCRQS